jgi:hypothetical protein
MIRCPWPFSLSGRGALMGLFGFHERIKAQPDGLVNR